MANVSFLISKSRFESRLDYNNSVQCSFCCRAHHIAQPSRILDLWAVKRPASKRRRLALQKLGIALKSLTWEPPSL